MNINNQRVLYSDNGTLTDISVEVNDYDGEYEIADFVASEDAIYIASPLPFNQKYFLMSTTVNSQASALTVSIWDGSDWKAAVDMVDRTSVGGASLGQSGYVSFRPDIDANAWVRELRSEDITGLTGTEIYSMYWAKLTWSDDWTAAVDIKHIGHRFSVDTDLYGRYPALNNATLRSSFNSQTTWDKQTFEAAEEIINDLMERAIATDGSQILDFSRFKAASIHKTAEIIYRGMEDAYTDQMKSAGSAYTKSMNMKNFYIDSNRNAELDDHERRNSGTRFMHR